MLRMFFKGEFIAIRKALDAFEQNLSQKALLLYTDNFKSVFTKIVQDAVKTFLAIKDKSKEILDKFVNMIMAGIKYAFVTGGIDLAWRKWICVIRGNMTWLA